MKINNKKGFTLAELLIVVAIIAVLVGISIPIFTTQLEKSREATDLANVRSAYADMMQEIIGSDIESKSVTVDLVQKKEGWSTKLPLNIAGVTYNGTDTPNWKGVPKEGGVCTITYDTKTNNIVFDWNGSNLAMNLNVQDGCWNKTGETNRQYGKMASTYNSGNSKIPGLYELEKGTTYKVSFTYDPHLDNYSNPTKGIVGRATLLYNENGKSVLDTGTGYFNIGKEINNNGVTYTYTKNDDGTLTYNGTFTTPTDLDKYYFGMNFGARKIDSNGKTSNDLDFSSLGAGVQEEFNNQIKSSFVLEKVN